MNKVVILKIDDYNLAEIKAKVSKALDAHFPFNEYFSPADKILLKPNLLTSASPDKAITTHPLFIEAVGLIFKERGLPVFIADSPGGFIENKDQDFVYEGTGIKELAKRAGFDLLYSKQSIVRNNYPLSWWADPGDSGLTPAFKMINLPKLKTHEIMILTLAVKNLYGCISGLYKSKLHHLHPKAKDFTQVLLNLNKMIKPTLNIVDGILALEGYGPAHKGKPKKLGVVVIGNNALYTDYVIANILGLKEQNNPLIDLAIKSYGRDIFSGEVISELPYKQIKGFKFPAPFFVDFLPNWLVEIIKACIKFKPKVNIKKCTACQMCVKVCPQQAIAIVNGKAQINSNICIYCMCCREMCRFAAVDLEKVIFGLRF